MHLSLLGVLSLCSLGAWFWLALFRGGFWHSARDEHRVAASDDTLLAGVRVEAVVPARDEAGVIAISLRSTLGQRFSGPFRVTLVDDHSTDETAEIARSASGAPGFAPLDLVVARPLPAGWSGKVNALQSGVEHALAAGREPDYWLFTDADIALDPDALAVLVAKALAERLDLVSLMVRLRCDAAWERLLIPAFVFFFQKLYPFAWANDPRRSTAAAAGGCILLSQTALVRIGGLGAIADRLIDDCALAAAVKRAGGRIWIGLSDSSYSLRAYDSLSELWRMVKRTAFVQLRQSYALLGGTVAGMLLLYAVPPVAAVAGILLRDVPAAAAALTAWFVMSLLYVPTLRAYRRSVFEAPVLPLAALLYTAMTVDAAIASSRKRGGRWKGRTYAASGIAVR